MNEEIILELLNKADINNCEIINVLLKCNYSIIKYPYVNLIKDKTKIEHDRKEHYFKHFPTKLISFYAFDLSVYVSVSPYVRLSVL